MGCPRLPPQETEKLRSCLPQLLHGALSVRLTDPRLRALPLLLLQVLCERYDNILGTVPSAKGGTCRNEWTLLAWTSQFCSLRRMNFLPNFPQGEKAEASIHHRPLSQRVHYFILTTGSSSLNFPGSRKPPAPASLHWNGR